MKGEFTQKGKEAMNRFQKKQEKTGKQKKTVALPLAT